MTYLVYADVLLGYYIGINFVLFFLISKLFQQRIRITRVILWAILTAAVSLGIFLLSMYIKIPYFIVYAISYLFMTYFFLKPYKSFAQILSCILAPLFCMLFLYGILSIFRKKTLGITDIIYCIPLSIVAGLLLIKICFHYRAASEYNQEHAHHLELCFHNRRIQAKGFLDTGNSLRNPYNGNPVIVLNPSVMTHAVSTGGYECIKEYINTGNFPYDRARQIEGINFFPLPYRTISSQFSLMPAFNLQEITIDKHTTYHNVTAGISQKNFMDKMDYQVLLHESLKPNREENSND